MKKRWNYILLALLALTIVAGVTTIIAFVNFLKPGVHSFAGYTQLDFQQKVFFVDADSMTCSGSSIVTVSGLIQPGDSRGAAKSFRGSMSVAQYPISLDDGYDAFTASASQGVITVISVNSESDSAQPDYTYWLSMSQNDPSVFAVFISLKDGTTVTAYPGQTQEEAVANCQAYWDWFQE
ncbi:MAG: hypothetical protein IJ448_02030 [Oscillospiraceae bacterium]|nr:hypothetical protein [Oscillospiraceae bacterium]